MQIFQGILTICNTHILIKSFYLSSDIVLTHTFVLCIYPQIIESLHFDMHCISLLFKLQGCFYVIKYIL